MRKPLTLAGITLLLATLTGCWKPAELPSIVDRLSFRYVGGTLFTNPDLLTMKEIHLDNGTLTGREIIVEGKVAVLGEHGTYLVLADDTARMLVLLTDLDSMGPLIQNEKPKILRVLGVVENGKKGLPQLRAHSVNLTKEPAGA